MNIDHLKDKFDLNELEVSILTYIKKNQKNLKNITIRQMAKDNFTSTSAIYRLCNKLKFSGYSDLIYHLSDNHHTHISTKNFEHYVPQFNQLLKKHQNSRIIVFGMGFSAPIADYICQRLTLNGFYAMSVIHTEMLDENFQDDSLLIIISNSGITNRLIDFVELAHKQHVDMLCFLANKNSKTYQYATYQLLLVHIILLVMITLYLIPFLDKFSLLLNRFFIHIYPPKNNILLTNLLK